MTFRVLIADDEEAARFGLARALRRVGPEIVEVADGHAALGAIRGGTFDLIFLDLDMPGLDGRSVLRELGEEAGRHEIVVVTANDDLTCAVECMSLGASDYVTKPYEVERLRAIAQKSRRRTELEGRVAVLQDQLEDKHAFGALIGVSRAMRELYSRIERAAIAPMDVLIVGETGTGKELIAVELHRRSDRAAGPFVALNTAAVSESLAESELFGHEKGAFTGADAARRGVFEQAHGGTLFLDEIGDMPLPLQAKMLRTLQERTVQPVGSSRSIPVDVRVISATHCDLETAAEEGHFRRDLYYRLKGIRLEVPSLRRRKEDIVLLVDHFLDRLEARSRGTVPRLAAEAVDRLVAHPWPGNVRELEHVVTAAAAMVDGPEIRAADLDFGAPSAAPPDFDLGSLDGLPLTDAKTRLVEWFERRVIADALEREGGNVSGAARRLGIHRQSLQQKMAQLGLRR